MIKIEITNGHGTFATTTSALDVMISRYLPGSPMGLRATLAEITGIPEYVYNDVYAASELLIMLADATGYAYAGASVTPDRSK